MKISSFQQKIKRHAKNPKKQKQKTPQSIIHSQDKKKWTDTVPKEAQTLDLIDKDFKSIILDVLKEPTEIMDKEVKGTRTMSHQVENSNKETEIVDTK